MFKQTIAVLIALGTLSFVGSSPGARASEGPATLSNLQIAYNLECNAQQQYAAYATTADREGFHKVASLFRAAERAEEIHAASHAAVIRTFGAVPEANVESVVARPTRENLRQALAEETYERDHMYRMFASQAREEHAADALASIAKARDAETTHAELFKQALGNLNQMKQSEVFLVCRDCGAVTTASWPQKCWTCGTHDEEFERID